MNKRVLIKKLQKQAKAHIKRMPGSGVWSTPFYEQVLREITSKIVNSVRGRNDLDAR